MIEFTCFPFQDLTLDDCYAAMALRQEVFIVEQNCPYLDADGKDQAAHHLLGKDAGNLVAYARLLPPGISYSDYASIGRVVTAPSARGKGYGKLLMQQAIHWTEKLFPDYPIKISAQCYLEDFYKNLGFHPTGDRYLEDGIPHIAMIRKG